LGRSLKHLLELTSDFEKREIGLISIHNHMDTTTAQGRLIFNIFVSLIEFDRIGEPTGHDPARGRAQVWKLPGPVAEKGGWTRGLTKEAEKTAILAQTLYNERKLGVNEIAADLKISKMTLYKYLRHRVTSHQTRQLKTRDFWWQIQIKN
jgi:DNA invertase Pin-like site-specific DNA recombinase